MKNITKKLIALLFIVAFFAFGAKAGAVGAPIFVSASATNITQTSAVIHGVVNPNGNNTTAWFRVQNGAQELGFQNLGSGLSNVTMSSYNLTGLTPNTSYAFSVVSDNDYGTTFGNWIYFTTSSNTPPPPSLPSVDLSASNTNMPYGGSTTISWSAYNANSCNGSGGSNGWSGYKNPNGGSFNTGALYNTTTYSITCSNSAGSDSDSVTIYVTPEPYNPPPPPVIHYPTVNLTASPTSVAYNGSSTLSWNSTYATSCSATGGSNGWSGAKNTSGTFYASNLTNTKTYNITCTNSYGSATDSVTIYVTPEPYNPPPPPVIHYPTVNLTASPTSVAYNGSSTLSWNSTYATSCSATGGSNGWSGAKNTSGTFYASNLTNTKTYNITCTNSYGSATDSVTVYVSGQPYNPPTLPTISLWVNTNNIPHNSSTTLTWNSSNATTCNGSSGSNGWDGPKGLSGSFTTGNLTQNTTYVITCNNSSGSSSDSVTVSVGSDNNNGNEENPSVSTKTATSIDEDSATLNGELEDLGDDNEVDVWFEYSDDRDDLEDGDGDDTSRENMDDEEDFSDNIRGLRKNTTYYFRAVARNDSGTDYGSIKSFRTDNGGINNNTCVSNNCAPQAVTTLATNIGSSSARLNGLGIINGNVVSTGYFEWGTSSFLGSSTPSNTIGISGSNPYSFSLFGLSPSTTYFYRAVVINQYGTSRGDISTFRTNTGGSVAGSSTTVVRNTTTVVSNEYSGVSRPSLVFLDVDRDDEVIRIGEVLDYTVDYRNISKENLYNVILQIHLPKELRFVDTSRGYFSEENNTVVVNIGDLNVGESGSVVVTAEVTADAELGKVVVIAANLAYTIVRNENQEEVFAYSKNTIENNRSNLAGAAIFGGSFFPNTLFGWLILLLIILLILLVARSAYQRTVPRRHAEDDHFASH